MGDVEENLLSKMAEQMQCVNRMSVNQESQAGKKSQESPLRHTDFLS